MFPGLKSKLTYANVIATLALFLALGGGAAWAATSLPKNSVGRAQLKAGAITGTKVANGSLLASNFAAGQLPSGPQGAQGPQGPQGEPGDRGARGDRGAQGSQGEPGDRGSQGDPGPQGLQGVPGAAGERGPQGNQGNPGARGEDGDKGARGERGSEGPEGQPGERGPRGDRGPEGPQGEPGEEGREGKAGTTNVITRFGPEIEIGREIKAGFGPRTSYAACKRGEVVTGGGFEFLQRPSVKNNYILIADRSSLFRQLSEEEAEELEEEEIEEDTAVYPAPKEGSSATGWAVTLESTGSRLVFRASVMCATP